MEKQRSIEEKKEIVIPCMHLPWECTTAKRIVLFNVEYSEYEKIVNCAELAASNTPNDYEKRSTILGDLYDKHMNDRNYNPIDCQDCKDNILDHLTSVISHPNPDMLMAVLCTRFYDYLYDPTNPNPRVRTKLEAKEYPVVEEVDYVVVNYIERHCLTLGREWCVTWVGVQYSRPQHPQLCNLKFKGLESVGVTFTCPICLEGQANKFENKNEDEDEDEDEDDDMKERGCKRGRATYCCSSLSNHDKKRRVVLNHDLESSNKETKVGFKEEIVALPCEHIYHESCISLWLQDARHNTCPVCRSQLPNTPVCAAWEIDQLSCLGHLFFNQFNIL